jgi:hypothetical protein
MQRVINADSKKKKKKILYENEVRRIFAALGLPHTCHLMNRFVPGLRLETAHTDHTQFLGPRRGVVGFVLTYCTISILSLTSTLLSFVILLR